MPTKAPSRLTQQLAYFAENDLPDLSSTRIDTDDPVAVRRALAEYLPMDTNLLNNLESAVALWPYIYDASVVDANGKALLHTNPQLVGKQVATASRLSRGHDSPLPGATSPGVQPRHSLRRHLLRYN